jgi:hypothetical protein
MVTCTLCVLAGAAPASAVTVTIGRPTVTSSSFSLLCMSASPCTNITVAQTTPGIGGERVTAPADGVITAWRAIGHAGGTAMVSLRVLEPAGGNQFKGAGRSTGVSEAGLSGAPNGANLPIGIGDYIGADLFAGNSTAQVYYGGEPGTYVVWATPGLAEGSTQAYSSSPQSGELMLNADVVLSTPVVSGLSPAGGSTAGGEEITITGDHLANATAVAFGGTQAIAFTNVSNTQVKAVVPAGVPGVADVRVTTMAGTSEPSAGSRYTYAAPGTPGSFGATTNVGLGLAAKQPSKRRVRVVVNNRNGFAVTGTLGARTVKPVATASRARRIALNAKAFNVPASSKKTVTLKLPRALRRSGLRSVKLRLTAKVNDLAGHTRTVTKKVALRLR